MIKFAKLISIEGPDQCGKQTQSNLLKYYLQNNGYKVKLFEIPFYDNFSYRLIYWMLRNDYAMQHPTTFQIVQYINKLIFQTFIFPICYFTNDYIVFDRWKLSGYVYGKATNVNPILNSIIYYTLFGTYLTIILIGKKINNKVEDSYEKNADLQCKVREIYSNIETIISNDNIAILNANDSIENIHRRIIDCVKCSTN